MTFYALQDLLPHDVIGKHARTKVHVPKWVFRPDHWTTTFLRGLIEASKDLESARVWEVGVGTGINLIALSDRIPDATWYFSDYNPACVRLAAFNLRAAGIDGIHYNPLDGRRNLVFTETDQAMPKVDMIFGCLPQVPTTEDLSQGDNVAHYYDPSMFPCSRRHACGLALNEALLTGARRVLSRKGKVILNLSGRVGEEHLREMFEECGYASRILYETIVPQHAATSLQSLAALESQGLDVAQFEFFADKEAEQPISAGRAEARRKKGEAVYHKIFVMEGTLQ